MTDVPSDLEGFVEQAPPQGAVPPDLPELQPTGAAAAPGKTTTTAPAAAAVAPSQKVKIVPTTGQPFRNIFAKPDSHYFHNVTFTKDMEAGRQMSSGINHAVVAGDPRGSVCVVTFAAQGNAEVKPRKIMAQRGAITDLEHSPFYPSLCAVGGESGQITVLSAKEGEKGLIDAEPVFRAGVQSRKLSTVGWNPVASHLLQTSAVDSTAAIWDLNAETPALHLSVGGELQWTEWSPDGKLLSILTKSGINIFDPRANRSILKSQPLLTSPSNNRLVHLYDWATDPVICAMGMDGTRKVCKVLDMRSLSLLNTVTIPQSSNTVQAQFDPSSGLLLSWARGDLTLNIHEWRNKELKHLTTQKLPKPAMSGCLLPKRAIDTRKLEIVRFFRAEAESKLMTVASCLVGRKDTSFSSELYPYAATGQPALTADQWLKGQNGDPMVLPMHDKEPDQLMWPVLSPPDTAMAKFTS